MATSYIRRKYWLFHEHFWWCFKLTIYWNLIIIHTNSCWKFRKPNIYLNKYKLAFDEQDLRSLCRSWNDSSSYKMWLNDSIVKNNNWKPYIIERVSRNNIKRKHFSALQTFRTLWKLLSSYITFDIFFYFILLCFLQIIYLSFTFHWTTIKKKQIKELKKCVQHEKSKEKSRWFVFCLVGLVG